MRVSRCRSRSAIPSKPIGTHVFTAMARNEAGLRWTAVTIDDGDDAKNALDRITIPQDVLDRIAPTALPRSSIIVSDEPLSAETNYRTEFVAVLSNQPQGGFITRTAYDRRLRWKRQRPGQLLFFPAQLGCQIGTMRRRGGLSAGAKGLVRKRGISSSRETNGFIERMTASQSPLLSAHGAQIPALGFGTSPMTGGLSPDTVVAALKAGYRHIDTAWKYGTERAVGEAMRASGVPRAGHLPHHQSVARIPACRRLRQVGGRESRRAAGRLRRSPAGALAQPGDPARRNHAGAGQGQAAGTGAAHRRCQLQHRAARSGDQALPRAAGGAAGRISSLSRPVEAARRGAPARHGVHRLLPARPRPAVQRSGAGRDRQGARQEHRADRAALADAAERRRHSALVESGSASPTISRCSISP